MPRILNLHAAIRLMLLPLLAIAINAHSYTNAILPSPLGNNETTPGIHTEVPSLAWAAAYTKQTSDSRAAIIAISASENCGPGFVVDYILPNDFFHFHCSWGQGYGGHVTPITKCGTINMPYGTTQCPALCPDATWPYYDPATDLCWRPIQEELVITLQGGESIEPQQSLSFNVTVENRLDHQPPKTPVTLNVSLRVDPTSGGHNHGNSTRPRGKISGTECNTDETCWTTSSSGTSTFSFNAPEASGKHFITVSCDRCKNALPPKQVSVMVKGLEPIPDSTFYVFVGGGKTKLHHNNHYLTPTASARLLKIAIDYQMQQQFNVLNWRTNTLVAPPLLHVNDASLEWGGRFDISGNWSSPHNEHMRGTTVDLRADEATGAIPPEIFGEFEIMLKNVVKEGSNKFLLECTKDKVDKKGFPPTPKHKRVRDNLCVSQLDGSLDSNRHYHVRLMGVKE